MGLRRLASPLLNNAYINRIATGVPAHDMHDTFVRFARTLLDDQRARTLFDRMAAKAQIGHRFSILPPAAEPEGPSLDAARVYSRGRFPSTGERMRLFEQHAPALAAETVAKLDLAADPAPITHLIVTSCTGMYAPGLDFDLIDRCGLNPSVERTMVGFMGCYAAINALKLARHIVRSSPDARVLVVDIELCSLHFQELHGIEQLLSFLVFADGCAASVVSAEPTGLAIDRFHAAVVPNTRPLITWKVRDDGFDMVLSGQVPGAISRGLESVAGTVLDGARIESIDLWAVHPGGRSVLDAVQQGLALRPDALAISRSVLERFGNMSSATVMFVLAELLASSVPDRRGCAMSFGPGLTAETMLFHTV
jgi:alpha-pyrone synthase